MPANAPAQGQLRGSQKLLEGLAKNGEVPSIDQIKKALKIESIESLRVPNWLIRGLPPAYLELEGTLEVPISQLNTLLNSFVQLNDSAINFVILINGIPIPDIATVTVGNT
ncbi:MAG: hypothetical protein ABSE86_18820 [Bryobacteraceae bacterium]|jgi:hypothetical protein